MGLEYDPSKQLVRVQDVELKRSSEKAGLYVINGAEIWIPFSQISDDYEDMVVTEGDEGEIVIPRWLAEEHDIEYDEID